MRHVLQFGVLSVAILVAGCSADVLRVKEPLLTSAIGKQNNSAPRQFAQANPYASPYNHDNLSTGSIGQYVPQAPAQQNAWQSSAPNAWQPSAPNAWQSSAPNAWQAAPQGIVQQPAPSGQTMTNHLSSRTVISPQDGTRVTVLPNETLNSISRKFGIPETSLREANAIPNGQDVTAGQQIIIPRLNFSNQSVQTQQFANIAPQRVVSSQPQRVVSPQPQRVATPQAQRASTPQVQQASITLPEQLAPKPYSRTTTAKNGITVYTVKSGDSLGSIAANHNISSVALAQANGLRKADPLRVGQKIAVPNGVNSINANDTLTTASLSKPQTQEPTSKQTLENASAKFTNTNATQPPIQTVQPKRPETVKKVETQTPKVTASTPVTNKPAPKASTQAVASSSPQFRWPVRGRVISRFGETVSGSRNDGINIAVPEGSPVKAAEDGIVSYVGNEVDGFGNLVLVKHSNGYVTAYAHVKDVFVKRGQAITRGQTIASAGRTGSVTQPQLHFEIRNASRPVNPEQYL